MADDVPVSGFGREESGRIVVGDKTNISVLGMKFLHGAQFDFRPDGEMGVSIPKRPVSGTDCN